MSDATLSALATGQHALVTLDQARKHLTADQLKHRLRVGRLVTVHPGVYRFAGAPVTWEQLLLAACLAARPRAVASHWAAGKLWLMPGIAAGAPEITVPTPRWARLTGVTVHRSDRLSSGYVTHRGGIPTTTPARTILDLSAVADPALVGKILDDSLRRRLLTLDEMLWCHRTLSCRGRRKVAVLRALLDARIPEDERSETRREAALCRILVAAGLPEPERQYEADAEGGPYHLDLAYPAYLIGIEFDGWEWHSTRTAFDHDRARDNVLELAGWLILRFTSTSSPDEIVRRVRAALRLRRAQGVHLTLQRGKIAG